MNTEQRLDPTNNSPLPAWRYQFLYPILIAILVACCLIPFIRISQLLDTDIGPYLMVVGLVTALQTFYVKSILSRHGTWGWRRAMIIASQFVSVIILTKLGEFLYNVIRTREYSFDLFAVTPVSLAVFTISLLIWLFVDSLSDQFAKIRDFTLLADGTVIASDSVEPYRIVMQDIFIGGAVILLLTGMLKIITDSILQRGSVGLTLYIPVYFLIAFVLLSQANYDRLQKRWSIQKTRVIGQTGAHWLGRSLVLIGLATGIAFIMPTGYTFGLLDVLRHTFEFLDRILIAMFGLIYLLVLLLARLFSSPQESATIPEGDFDLASLAERAEETPPPFFYTWNWDLIRVAASWIIAVAVLIIVGISLYRDNPEFFDRLRKSRFWQALVGLWKSTMERMRRTARIIGERLPDIIPEGLRDRLTRSRGPRWPGMRLNSLTPRERVRYYYLSLLHRATDAGLGRRPTQTPYEYQQSLAGILPDDAEDIETLTGAFIEARYSPQPIEVEPPSAKEAWKRLRAVLQRLVHQKEDQTNDDKSD